MKKNDALMQNDIALMKKNDALKSKAITLIQNDIEFLKSLFLRSSGQVQKELLEQALVLIQFSATDGTNVSGVGLYATLHNKHYITTAAHLLLNSTAWFSINNTFEPNHFQFFSFVGGDDNPNISIDDNVYIWKQHDLALISILPISTHDPINISKYAINTGEDLYGLYYQNNLIFQKCKVVEMYEDAPLSDCGGIYGGSGAGYLNIDLELTAVYVGSLIFPHFFTTKEAIQTKTLMDNLTLGSIWLKVNSTCFSNYNSDCIFNLIEGVLYTSRNPRAKMMDASLFYKLNDRNITSVFNAKRF